MTSRRGWSLVFMAIALMAAHPLVLAFQSPPAARPGVLLDGGWPRSYRTASGGRLVLYEFQVSQWQDQREITASSAVSYLRAGATKADLGTITFEATTDVSVGERLVAFSPIRIVNSHFSTLSPDQVRELVAEIGRSLPNEERVMALDRVLAQVASSAILPGNQAELKADPPTVFFSTAPAVVVNIDGDPIWSSIDGVDLRFAVNTNWDLFEHGPSKTFYLRHEAIWLRAAGVDGPWVAAGKLPDSFSRLPAAHWSDVKASLPGKSVRASQLPKVFVSHQPAELILLQGAPRYVPVVTGSPLHWVSNSESDVFRMGTNGPVYYLVSGRWFSAPDFSGPWTFATLSLPAAFKQIPVEHDRSRVLASVPGTAQAAEAVLLAQVPQTARVNKSQVKAPEVIYQGEPQFVAIEQTNLYRAANTDKDVVRAGDRFYLCYDAIWFVSSNATGPWMVASTIPADVYSIPPSSPVHHVTYVTVKADPDPNWVVVVAAGGYTGMMIAWGVPVWGTGWYYPPYMVIGPRYPIYYPYFPCYGASAWYNPWTGAYGRSATVYGPYGGAGAAARYNPRTGTYARGAVAWGPYGARGAAQAFNPRTGTYAQTRQGASVFSSWGSTYVQRGDDWARTNRYTNRVTGTTTRTVRTDDGDFYAGRDGNVYRREDGSWQKYEDGTWSSVQRPAQLPASISAPVAELERAASGRAEGAERSRGLERFRQRGEAGDAGSYRARPERGEPRRETQKPQPKPKA
jgi:hypothetical protein